MTKCKCGCGETVRSNQQYIRGHNSRVTNHGVRFKSGQVSWNKGKPAPWSTETHKGKPKDVESIKKRTQTRRRNFHGQYSAPGRSVMECRNHAKWLRNITKANQARDNKGRKNPFFGKKHTLEARAKMSIKLSGSNHPAWQGGTSTLPYGPEFTRKFKRIVRQRDNQTCQRCGKSKNEVGCTLQVHHIDHDKMNNDPTNLVTVCGSCNVWLSYHREDVFRPPIPPIG